MRITKADQVMLSVGPVVRVCSMMAGETAGRTVGLSMRVAIALTLSTLAGCAKHPQTDQDLEGEAENAVDTKLDTQATFTLMESALCRRPKSSRSSSRCGAIAVSRRHLSSPHGVDRLDC